MPDLEAQACRAPGKPQRATGVLHRNAPVGSESCRQQDPMEETAQNIHIGNFPAQESGGFSRFPARSTIDPMFGRNFHDVSLTKELDEVSLSDRLRIVRRIISPLQTIPSPHPERPA
jgi:hypothetical protein